MDFDAILKSSLAAVNDNYQAALSDVIDVVESIHAAIQKNAGSKYALIFTDMSADIKGSTFRVYFDTNKDVMRSKLIDILFIRIPSAGYPVGIGTIDKSSKIFLAEETVSTCEELKKYFAQLLQNPESSLIQAIGFAMRTEDEEETPF